MTKTLIKRSKRIFQNELGLNNDEELIEQFQKNRFWCSLSNVDENGINQMNGELEAKFNEWFAENCEGHYMFSFPNEGTGYTNSGPISIYISFELTEDATHFKLRWAE